MIKNSIKAKIILLFAIAFSLVFFIVLTITHLHLTGISDSNQRVIYEEKINNILSVIQRQADRLEATGRVDTYKETFQHSTLKTLRHTYYNSPKQRVYPFILNFNRNTVMHPVVPYGAGPQKDAEFIKKLTEIKDGDFDYFHPTGEKKWMIFRSFPKWQWVVGYAVPHDVKYSYVNTFKNRLAFIMAAIMTVALLVLVIMITRLMRPIIELTVASKAIADGVLSTPINVVQEDELGTLATSFINMREEIGEKISSLNNMNQQLEGEIAIRSEAEATIKRSLYEKEVLLKEVHHRVKNNMAVISSLLALQSEYIEDDKAIEKFKESRSRINSMALVHEKLYQTENFAEINVQDYVKSLAETVGSTFGMKKEYNLITNIDKINVDIDTLIPCGLIMNELLTNSFKHAFNDNESPEIKITMKRIEGDNISLTLADNGKGMPSGFDISQSKGLGLKLVEALTAQIDGTLKVSVEQGVSFNIVFPDKIKFS